MALRGGSPDRRVLRIATRGSEQARAQTSNLASLIRSSAAVDVEFVVVETTGDLRRDVPLEVIGGQGVFVKEVQAAVLDGRADVAVHSAKDLPASVVTPGLVLACVPERRDARDAMVGSLPVGATVATGSARRRVQLAAERPDLRFVGLRGNIPTRLAKVGSVDAVMVAMAALQWLGRTSEASRVFSVSEMVPQVGQGAMAAEARAEDQWTRSILAALEHRNSRIAVDAERAFLAYLGAGCSLPVGAHAVVTNERTGALSITGMLASESSSTEAARIVSERSEGVGTDVGRRLAERLLARLEP